MVEAVRKNQGVDREHKNFTGYIKATVLGTIRDYSAKDFLIPIPKDAYKGQKFQLPPRPHNGRASVEHHRKKEQYAQLKEALAELPILEREVLILRSESWTLDEIAASLDMPRTNIVRIESRALDLMRTLMIGGK